MADIKCPNCGDSFTIDESGYAKILQQVRNDEFERELAIRKAELEKLKKAELDEQKAEEAKKLESIIREFEEKLKAKDKEIELYRDFKISLSTKMVGESLEQHCECQFNQLRATAFPNAYFEKDNDAKDGTKGDYIYRESADGVEFISIMFEMKNEMESTEKKHTNEFFLKKLDDDRKKKGCEYAVLVSLLEKESELYNTGIVDMSHKFPKMYVIRPQFFIPMITLLRNAALNSLEFKKELQRMQEQEVDVTQFEANLASYTSSIENNHRLAGERFTKAVKEIDDAIAALVKAKEDLLTAEDKLRLAEEKAKAITIRKLIKNAPTVKEMFDELKN